MIKEQQWSNQQGVVYSFCDKRLLRDVGFGSPLGCRTDAPASAAAICGARDKPAETSLLMEMRPRRAPVIRNHGRHRPPAPSTVRNVLELSTSGR
jgi:hypothetical protein